MWSADGFTGRRITTEHYELISTLNDREFEAALPGFVEAIFEQCRETLPARDEPTNKLTTYIFGTRSEWMRFTRRRFPSGLPVYSKIKFGGYTEGTTSVVFYANRSHTLAAIAHEGWHQYAAAYFNSPLPAWLNEGLACCVEAVQFAGRQPKFTPRHNTFRINSLRDSIQQGTLVPLSELVADDPGDPLRHGHERAARGYYAQSWSLITFLRHGAGGRYAGRFRSLLGDIAEGKYRQRISAARLALDDGRRLTAGELTFAVYFDCAPEELSDLYYDHIIRVAGY